MTIEFTILGVLVEQPTHGYSIKKTLLESFSKNLGLNDGQLYPALARLERRGWIEKEVVEQRKSPTKHLYRVTDDGREAFYGWLAGTDPDAEPPRYDFFWRYGFLQKCGFFRHLEPEQIRDQTDRKLEEVEQRLEELTVFHAHVAEKKADPYRLMIVDYGIRYERMRKEWLQDLRARALDQIPERKAALGA